MNSAAMREKMMPTITLAIEDSSRMKSAERTDRHRGQAGKNAGDAEQRDQRDDQPVKGLDDGGRDEAVPLKQIPKFKHRSFSRQVEYELRPNWMLVAQGLAPNAVPGKSGGTETRLARGASHAGGPVEIAVNNGHNRAPFRQSPS